MDLLKQKGRSISTELTKAAFLAMSPKVKHPESLRKNI
jgi:hypothetical protein